MLETRLPAVYVTVEDRSMTLPAIESGRSVLVVILGDRGPHNRICTVTSIPHFIRLFGKPNIDRTGQGHYLVERSLRFTNRVYVIRASLIDSDTESKNASIANVTIKYNAPDGSEEQIFGKFVFTNEDDAISKFETNFVSKFVFTDIIGFEQFRPGDYIYKYDDDDIKIRKIVAKDRLVDGVEKYYLELEDVYQGSSTVDIDDHNNVLVNFIGLDTEKEIIAKYNPSLTNKYAERNLMQFYPGVSTVHNSSFKFTKDSNLVEAIDQASFDSVKSESWLFPATATSDSAMQIVDKEIDDSGKFIITLDRIYTGETTASPIPIKSYIPIELVSNINIRQYADIDIADTDNIYTFVARGTGSYYNNIYLKGYRNYNMEKLYVTNDDNAEPLYKYMFMDLVIMQQNNDGTNTILEGPWSVSLVNRVETGSEDPNGIIRDRSTGEELYIETVINRRSEFINCFEAHGISQLEGLSTAAEQRRLQVMSLFSEGVVTNTSTRGKEGFVLENGEDGILYNRQKRINLYDGEVLGTVERAYAGVLASDEFNNDANDSIKLIKDSLYPWYEFDYILTGGYPAYVQKAAADLALSRKDCLVLGDTGSYMRSAAEDLTARREAVPWNNWCAALYVQYRKINDSYTGKPNYFTPVIHAIERHLKTDRDYWIAEPVAGIEKGAIEEPITLAYRPDTQELEELQNAELNGTFVEKGGKYFMQQFTTWKRFSKLKRIHVAKFIHYVRKSLPPLLKDVLHRKADAYWLKVVEDRIRGFLSPYTVESGRYAALEKFSQQVVWDDARSTINVNLILSPIRSIESINIAIIVV